MKILKRLLVLVLVGVFIYAGYYLAQEYLIERGEQQAFRELASLVEEGMMNGTRLSTQMIVTVKLRGENPPEELRPLEDMTRDFLMQHYSLAEPRFKILRMGFTEPEGEDAKGPDVSMLFDGKPKIPGGLQEDWDEFARDVSKFMAGLTGDAAKHTSADLGVVIERADMLEQYVKPFSQNSELVGWLKIDGMSINYPVMQTKDDPEYYLRRNFKKSYAYSGTPFVDAKCDLENPTTNAIVYAHNMRSGTMFGELQRYGEQSFYENHKVIRFDLINEEREYEVFAAFRAKALEFGQEGFRYYEYTNLPSRGLYKEYVSEVIALSVIDTGITPLFGDEIMTLTTCSSHEDEGRFVVVAKRIA